jgi:hypothetical protein
MARNSDLEEIDVPEGVDPQEYAEAQEKPENQKAVEALGLRSDTFQGYPSRGAAPSRDAPFGKNKPKYGTNPEGTVANPAPDPPADPPSFESFNFGGEVERKDGTPAGLPDTNPTDDKAFEGDDDEQAQADLFAAEQSDISMEPARAGKRRK